MSIRYHNHLIFLFFLLMLGITVSAQQENKWVFGYHAGLDFSSGTPVPFKSAIEGFGEGNASICDENGQLLFYTEGSFVWDRSNNLMPNGSNLTGLTSATAYSVTSSASQGTMIIPMPGNTKRYFVFSLTSMEQNGLANAGRLYYSVIDMSLNGGMGDVVPGMKGIFVDSALSERMTAVVGDRCNIWVITCSIKAQIKAYEVNFSEVNRNAVVSPVGISQEFTGYLEVSPDGKKIAATKCYVFGQGTNGTMLFDFDISTGLASNPVSLLPPYGAYGLAFSPDNKKLYVSAAFQFLYQYDISSNNAATIQASETLIGSSTMTGLKLATDGKIYCKSSDNSIGVINAPNLGGLACQYVPNAFNLAAGTTVHSGLPNTVPTFTFSKDTIYTTTELTDVCFNNSITMSPTNINGWTYEWSDGATGKEHIVKKSGTYWVGYYTSPCSYNIDTFHTIFPTVYTTNSCEGQANGAASVERAAGDSNTYSYTWKDTSGAIVSTTDKLTNAPAGTYTLLVTSVKGCNSELTIVIGVDVYKVSFVADTLVCQEEQVFFQNTSDPYFTTQDWLFGDGNSATIRNPYHSFTSPGTYQVRLVGMGPRCSDTTYRQIQVDAFSKISFSADKDNVCTGIPILFSPYPESDSTIVGFNWSFGGEIAASNSWGAVQHAFDEPGAIPVRLTATFRACPDQIFEDTVHIAAFPTVDLGADSSICLNGKAILLRNLSRDGTDNKYLWSTGSKERLITVKDPGAYSLTVTSVEGCKTTEFVIVKKDCYLDIPNAFTPNGDGFNDFFFPRRLITSGVTKFTMQILDRWGQKIFESNNVNGAGWDGRFNSKEQPQGTYVYLIDIEVGDTISEHYNGNVTLIR